MGRDSTKLSLENANLLLSVKGDFHQVYTQIYILYKSPMELTDM